MNRIEQVCDQQEWYSFEGVRGVERLTKLVAMIGYQSIGLFLEDNPGAIEALLNFIGDHATPGSEWAANLEITEEEDDE